MSADETRETAYVTGGASGIGKALVRRLVSQNVRVCIADINLDAAQNFTSELNQEKDEGIAACVELDVASWDSQVTAMKRAVEIVGRLDYVFAVAGIGERPWLFRSTEKEDFPKPDLSVLDVDLNGLIYTATVAIHQFRRQGPGRYGFRGKIVCVASICGFYSVPTLPIYTAAKWFESSHCFHRYLLHTDQILKSGVTGFVRSFGKYLPEEKITLNSVNPNVVQTGIYVPGNFYKTLGEQKLFTPIGGVVDVFIQLMGSNDASGQTFEVGPRYDTIGAVPRHDLDFLDHETEVICDLINESWLPIYRGLTESN